MLMKLKPERVVNVHVFPVTLFHAEAFATDWTEEHSIQEFYIHVLKKIPYWVEIILPI